MSPAKIIDVAKVVTCPFCGRKKELLALCSGSMFRAIYWSDFKQLTPFLPHVSLVQKCRRCKKYFLLHNQPAERGTMVSFTTGDLSYREWKEAYMQFCQEQNHNMKDWRVISLGMIQAFNDRYFRGPTPFVYKKVSTPPKEEYDFFVDVIARFINVFDWIYTRDILLKAELYREIGKFEQCAETLKSIDAAVNGVKSREKNFDQRLYANIWARMENRDIRVFQIL